MRTRISSIVIGVSHLVVGGYLGHVAGKFAAIYADLYSTDATLPVLTRIVLALAPVGWIAFGIVAAAFLIGSETHDRRPNHGLPPIAASAAQAEAER